MTNNTLLNNNEKMIALLSELVEEYEQSSVHNDVQASLETLHKKMEQAKQLVNKYKEDKAKRVNEVDGIYFDLLNDILANGSRKEDRTGTGTISVFSRELRFDLKKGFPILTTKRVPLKLIASELAWFIKGDTNIEYLLRYDNHIWDEWPFKKYVESEEYKNDKSNPDMTDFARRAEKDPEFKKVYEKELEKFITKIKMNKDFAAKHGDIGRGAYGAQWRSFDGPDEKTSDQLKDIIHQIKTNPDSRRLLILAWNPVQVVQDALLPPCHYAFQFEVLNGKISCKFSMRSTDVFLGLPFNLASYALLTHLVAIECGLEVDELIFSGGNIHIYSNHLEQVHTQLQRELRELPKLVIDSRVESIFDFEPEDAKLIGYNPHPAIKAPVSV